MCCCYLLGTVRSVSCVSLFRAEGMWQLRICVLALLEFIKREIPVIPSSAMGPSDEHSLFIPRDPK